MIPDDRYEVRNEKIERALRTLAALINDEVPEKWGWGLIMVPFGVHKAAPKGKGAVFWISNARREDMVEIVQSWVDDAKERMNK